MPGSIGVGIYEGLITDLNTGSAYQGNPYTAPTYQDPSSPVDYSAYQLQVLDLLYRIARQVINPVQGQLLGADLITGSGTVELSAPISQVIFQYASLAPPNVNTWFGSPNIYQLGRFAWMNHPDSNSPATPYFDNLEFLNFTTCVKFSQFGPRAGFMYNLPDGVSFDYKAYGVPEAHPGTNSSYLLNGVFGPFNPFANLSI